MSKYHNISRKSVVVTTIILSVIMLSSHFLLADILSLTEGTDDKAKEVIGTVAPNYKPWFTSIWEPSSESAETYLFALQTLIGVTVIGFYVFINERKKLHNKA